jgi:hypothetical protein
MCEVEVGRKLGVEKPGDVSSQAVGVMTEVLLAARLLPWEAVPQDKYISPIC